ncbi:MAG TPA: PLP-dependent aspartate aminotransferase family protein [Aestuariivirgaceae bacterium]|nr:PLP-dependent aspartate aminotransferase family protein [Aestuariivirgaceae bacterium]
MSDRPLRPETVAAHSLRALDAETGAVVPPLHTSTTYARDADYALRGASSYLRYGNPTVAHAEAAIAALERGHAARVFGSGMAAIVTLFETVPKGAHVVAPAVMYYGTRDWLKRLEGKGRIQLTFFDPADRHALAAAMTPHTDIVWIETPVNPTWDVIDIAAAAEAAHGAGAILAVDSTVATPVLTQPLALGADIVFHAATKYLNGHSDVLGGVLVTASDSPRWEEIAALRNAMGTMLAPVESWMLIRGLRTLFVRVRQASATALALASHLEAHSKVEAVLYPGLPSHAGHAVASRQMAGGFGGMMSVLVKGGEAEALAVVKRLKVFLPATSLGGIESLAEHRRTVEGPASPVPGNLIRLSIGLEALDDLIQDMDQALSGI